MMNFDISLYGILDPEHCNGRNLAQLAEIAMQNGVTILQYRSKLNDTRQMILDVNQICEAVEGSGVPIIVNDRVDIALSTKADGVHLGQNDMPAEMARKLLGPEKIIGVSIKTIEDAKSAPMDFIDYAFIGGVFDTQTKDNPPGMGIEGWRERADILKAKNPSLPIGAIAGITSENVASLFASGVEGVALISYLFKADDVALACQNMASKIPKKES